MKFLGLSVAVAGGVLLMAQSGPQSIAPVNLNVTAIDSQGRLVPNLQAGDFQVLDNGKPRPIVWVRELPRKGPPATFILLDLLNADFAARGLSATEITRAVERLESGDNVYLYLLTAAEKIFAIHSVRQAGAQATAEDGPWTRRVKPMLDQALRQVNGLKTQDDRYAYLRIEPTWKALAVLIPQLAEVPGPKSFVWITQGVENGFFDQGRTFQLDTAPLRTFAANLNALQTAAYSVEQRPNGSLPPQNEGSPGDTLAQLSELTGGHVYPSDATGQAIEQATGNPLRMNYRIAFLPDRLDGKYHKIRVTAMRKDIKVQTAERYYAVAPPDAAQRDQAIEDAAGRSAFDYPAIAFTAAATPVQGSPGQFRFSIRVHAADVELLKVDLLKQGARYKGSLGIAFVESQPDGQKVIADGKPADLDLSADEYAKALTDGIEITSEAKLDAASTQVRVVVLDLTSNLAGTATVPTNAK